MYNCERFSWQGHGSPKLQVRVTKDDWWPYVKTHTTVLINYKPIPDILFYTSLTINQYRTYISTPVLLQTTIWHTFLHQSYYKPKSDILFYTSLTTNHSLTYFLHQSYYKPLSEIIFYTSLTTNHYLKYFFTPV